MKTEIMTDNVSTNTSDAHRIIRESMEIVLKQRSHLKLNPVLGSRTIIGEIVGRRGNYLLTVCTCGNRQKFPKGSLSDLAKRKGCRKCQFGRSRKVKVKRERGSHHRFRNLLGQTIGGIKITGSSPKDRHGNTRWQYECLTCGQEKVAQRASVLRNVGGCRTCAIRAAKRKIKDECNS